MENNTTLLDYFNSFLQMRISLGFSVSTYDSYLKKFVLFCNTKNTEYTGFDRSMLNEWLQMMSFSSTKTQSNVISDIRGFAKYLNSVGKENFIPQLDEYKQPTHSSSAAYIFDDYELKELFHAIDTLHPREDIYRRHIVIPVLFRMMYCCGMRPAEPIHLKNKDVNLRNGEVIIRQSKGNKDRRIIMSEDLINLCSQYEKYMPSDRTYYFQRTDKLPIPIKWVDEQFNRCIKVSGLFFSRKPRPYDLRHSFATRTIMRWTDEKKDIMTYLPYLSAYMGHSQIKDTLYYVHLLPDRLRTTEGVDWECLDSVYREVCDEKTF